MSNELTDETTDITQTYLWESRNEAPHKGGWFGVCGDWLDAHTYAHHAGTCYVCRTEARNAAQLLTIRARDDYRGRETYVLSDGRVVVWSDCYERPSQLLHTGEDVALIDEELVTALILAYPTETPSNG